MRYRMRLHPVDPAVRRQEASLRGITILTYFDDAYPEMLQAIATTALGAVCDRALGIASTAFDRHRGTREDRPLTGRRSASHLGESCRKADHRR